ncbi:MAG: tetratricopeptide repeat protein [Dysgonamonadaceae bacterium]|jgi:hypothetical protein|nr:tetratricopeptide repeat protein [Dysgonamonadaceae bacterium]
MKKTLTIFLICISQVLIAQTYDEDVVMKACSCIYNAEGDSIDSIVNSCLIKALYHSLAEDGISKQKIMQDYSNPKNIQEDVSAGDQTTFADYLDMLYKNCSATRYLIEKNPSLYKEMLDSAASYLANGNSEKALSTYAKLIRYYPDDPEGYFGLGLISLSDNDYVTTARLMKHAYMIYSVQESDRARDCKEYLKAAYYYLKKEGKDSLFAAVAREFIPPIYQPENFNQLQNVELNNEIDCRLMEPQILICDNYILSTPVNDKEMNRKYAIETVIRWMAKTPNYIYHIDKNVVPILDAKGNVLAVFTAAMTKFSIENPEQGNDSKAAALYAWNTILDYVADKANNIKLTGELKKKIKAKNNGTLEKQLIINN